MHSATAPLFGDLPYADPGAPDLRSVRHLVAWLSRRVWTSLLWGGFLGVAWMGAQALIPVAVGQGIAAVSEADQERLTTWTWLALALAVGQIISGILRHRVGVRVWLASAVVIQQLVARHASALGSDLTDQMATGEVVAVSSNDVERVGQSMEMLPRAFGAIVVFFGVATSLIITSPALGLVVVIGVPLLVFGIGPLLKPLERRESDRRAKVGRVAEIVSDIVGGLRVLRGIGGENLFLDRFAAASQEVRAASIRAARVRTLMDAFQVLMPGLFILVIIWAGAILVRNGQLDVGALIAFYGMSAFLALPLRSVGHTARIWTAAIPAYRRIVRLLRLEPLTHDPANPRSLDPTGDLVDHVSGVHITAGALTVIACDNPETADALADRLGGFRERDEVSLGDVRLSAAARVDIRRTIVVQDKDPVLLSGTIGELLDIPGSSPTDIADALQAAYADEVIESLDGEGMDAVVVERGRTLSGGQRQRLALARSLLTHAPVLILVEPTSAVDSHTEARIAEGVSRLRQSATTVVFSTSPLLLDAADEVHYVVGDRLAASGRHAQLVDSHAGYRAQVIRDMS